MNDTAKQIIKLKDELDDLKDKQSKYEGKRESLYDRLKKEFKCDNLKQAEQLKEKLSKKITSMTNKLESKIEEFTENYEICD
jgi:hypothetical protein